MLASFHQRHRTLFDLLYFVAFLALILLGALFLNAFVFRSFNVVGPSMEPTLMPGDRLIVNKVPKSIAGIQGRTYIPERGQIVVFTNPNFNGGRPDEFIVKRVIGLPGEHVVVHEGSVTVYNKEHPDGFDPDKPYSSIQSPTSGSAEVTVPKDELFVMGDNRVGNHSLDSRNGLGTIPVELLQGTVAVRVFPLQSMRLF